MSSSRQNIVRRFVERPPKLAGGLSLALEPVGERHARLRVDAGDRVYEAVAGGLSVPYASGLSRLLAADPEVQVALVEHAPRGLDRAAEQQGVGYLDLRGRGRLIGPGFVYVAPPLVPHPSRGGDVEGTKDPWSSKGARGNATVSPFAPKASRIVRAFLSEPDRRWRLSEFVELCDMNPGNVHRVLGALAADDLIERDGDHYVLPDPGSLLEAWSDQGRRGRPGERLSIPVRGPLPDAVRELVDVLGEHAVVSGELAAEMYAPHLPAESAIVHRLDDGPLEGFELSSFAPVRSLRSPSHIVIDRADEGVGAFRVEREGLPLVSPQQLFFDLYREHGRAREASEHVRREVLSY